MIKKINSELGTEGSFLRLLQDVYKTPTADVTLSGENRRAPPWAHRQAVDVQSRVVHTVLGILAGVTM